MLVSSLTISLGCFAYLFLSFLFPEEAVFATSAEIRVAVLVFALVTVSLFTLVALADPDVETDIPGE